MSQNHAHDIPAAAAAICARFGNRPDELLEILHVLQEEVGFVPEEALPAIAKALNRSRAEIHGVVTFYHDYRREAPGRHVVKICRGEACQSVGAEKLCADASAKFKTGLGATSADGKVTLEAVYCLGNCALGPAAMVDGKLIGRADLAKLEPAE